MIFQFLESATQATGPTKASVDTISDSSLPIDKMARLFISQKPKLSKVTLQNRHALDLLTA